MRRAAGEPAFAEIGAASCFSFLRGASQPEELVVTAHRLGLAGLGLADRNTVAGVVRAYQAAEEAGLAFAPGARLVFADDTPDVFAYPRDRAGWGRLCRLLSLGNLRTEKGDCRLFLDDLLDWGEGLNLAVLAPASLGAGEGDAVAALEKGIAGTLVRLEEAFSCHVRLAAAPAYDGRDQRRLARAARTSRDCRVPLMATNDVFHHAPGRRRLQDVMTAIREHVPLAEAGKRLSRNAERHLKPAGEMARLFSAAPQAVEAAGRFFAELSFDLKSLSYEYPDEALKRGRTPAEELCLLAEAGAKWRYPQGVPESVSATIAHELKIIGELQYEPYFLTVHHIVEFARSKGILCQGRGSAANSVVCYVIGVTEVSPERAGLLFERFISSDRREPPDIDIDFEHERREEVIQYIFEHYGRNNAALAATVITYRARSAAREVGKAFGLSEDAVSALSGSVWGYSSSDMGEREAQAAGLSTADPTTANVLKYAAELAGFPRHLSQHVGGFVITRGRIDEVVPILNSAMEGRTIVEWDKDDLDALGILKIDILALGMLSCLRRAFVLLEAHYGERITLAKLSEAQDDQPTYRMTQRADTLGVFQIESRAQMTMLPKLRPDCFYDLVIEVAIVRPGPIQGDMVHPYLRRKMGLEPVTYPSPDLERVLGRTLGVPLFQEQAMMIAIVAAGFTPNEADRLRRAMATFRRVGTIHTFQKKMVEGMVARGYERDFAERCFKQIEGFGEYGFPESHAASFALLVYASCWLKCHYPDVFAAALLNAQPMGFYAPAQIVRDAREHGVEILPVDVNASLWDQTLEPGGFDPARIKSRHREMAGDIRTTHAVRLGFRQVKGLAEAEMAALVAARGAGYDSVRDLWLRSGLKRSAIERLADADAFASLGLARRDALWACRALDPNGAAERLPLFEGAASAATDLQCEPDAYLPPMLPGEEVIADYRFLSLSLKAHPVAFVRRELDRRRMVPTETLERMRSGSRVTVAGIVLIRQRPGSAKGVIFMTIEDETGVANVIVWPKIFERFRPLVLGARFVAVTGRMQSDHGVIHVVADRLEDLTPLLAPIAAGEDFSAGAIAPGDHVRAPLRRPSGARIPRPENGELAASAEAAASLGAALARADEVRRPIGQGRGFGASSGRRPDLRPAANAGPAAAASPMIRQVLPKGRNFQ
ncbi:error-prone DNA polymerase [Aurantimonas sp. VKM B-3413]|uniref:error-prone DNA polymerase n=1 Tax=Aurantimonas sp. VKM B-3413 TaxID=2779401 RepID=UPI001E5DD6F9|nr:error-prone DNA polymerase [Aurantimonas sp. VKM B-3413]MCB8837707.1 error-prone DNA polymerase [Aurantimonas sp. VKM B-3413]